MSARILLVDNYDSFTYNLAHLFEELGAEVTVLRNDAVDAGEISQERYASYLSILASLREVDVGR